MSDNGDMNDTIKQLPLPKKTAWHKSKVQSLIIVRSCELRFKINSTVACPASMQANYPKDNLTLEHLSPPKKKYWDIMAYNNAKLCNVLFMQELADRWKHRGISVFAVHPGNMVSTQIQRNWWVYRLLFFIVRPFTKSLQQAAATTIYCATANELTGLSGYYFNNCFFCKTSKLSHSEPLRQQLWKLSEDLVKNLLENSTVHKPTLMVA